MLLKQECSTETVIHEHVVSQDLTLNKKIGKLWIEYLKMVRVLLIFIRAERTGD